MRTIYMRYWRQRLEIDRLKRETFADHEAVEKLIPLMKPGLSTAEYVACLERLYGMIAAWEARALSCAPEWLQPLLIPRRRKHLLEQDLEWFGAKPPREELADLPPIENETSLLGAMYVIEGSTLGGQLIARHVEDALGLGIGQGTSFFRGYGKQTGAMWKEFCDVLRGRVAEDDSLVVINAARDMFRRFGAWMQDT
jgi:heme oxygenase